MKKIAFAFAAAGAIALTACGPQDAAEDIQEQELESQEDILEEEADMADEMGMEAEEEMLDDRADAIGDMEDELEGDGLGTMDDEGILEEDTTEMEIEDEM